MRHGNKVKKFGHTNAHRNSVIRNLAKSLLEHEHITTTTAKARAVVPFVERLLTKAEDNTHARRQIEIKLGTDSLTEKIVKVYADRYKDKNSGYVRSYKIGFRKGDGAEQVKLMLVGYEPKEKKSKLTKVTEE